MIYPTRRCVVAALAGAPVALVLGLVQPGLWLAAPVWLLAVGTLMLLDALLAPWPRGCRITFEAPGYLAVAAPATARLTVAFGKHGRIPRALEAALDAEARVGLRDVRGKAREPGVHVFELQPERRGQAIFNAAIVRWQGPLGLIWRQARQTLAVTTPIGSDIRRIEDEAVRMFSRDALHGTKVQLDLGEGTEFRSPMAIAVIGGLITSTALSLVFVPVAFSLIDGVKVRLERRLYRLTHRQHGEAPTPAE